MVLPGRGGEGREWRGIREVAVWQRVRGGRECCMSMYVPVNSGASVYFNNITVGIYSLQ